MFVAAMFVLAAALTVWLNTYSRIVFMIVDFPVPASPIRYTIELFMLMSGLISGYIQRSKNVALCRRLLILSVSVSG